MIGFELASVISNARDRTGTFCLGGFILFPHGLETRCNLTGIYVSEPGSLECSFTALSVIGLNVTSAPYERDGHWLSRES